MPPSQKRPEPQIATRDAPVSGYRKFHDTTTELKWRAHDASSVNYPPEIELKSIVRKIDELRENILACLDNLSASRDDKIYEYISEFLEIADFLGRKLFSDEDHQIRSAFIMRENQTNPQREFFINRFLNEFAAKVKIDGKKPKKWAERMSADLAGMGIKIGRRAIQRRFEAIENGRVQGDRDKE